MSNIPPVVKNLIIINAIMFLATIVIGEKIMIGTLALFPWGSPLFRGYQLLTHMFMHGGFWHLFFNMYTLFFFGRALENVWGGKKFLFYYFVCGFGAAICHLFVMFLTNEYLFTPTVGASGAIYGLLLAYGMLFPNTPITLIFPVPITLKAKWFVCIFGGIELVTGLTGINGGVAHFAHLGGMLFGIILITYWKKNNREYY